MIHDPKFESQRRRTRKGLERLIESDGPQDHDTKEEKAYVIEDGWAIDVEAPWATAAKRMVQRAQDAAREPRASVLGDNFAVEADDILELRSMSQQERADASRRWS